MGFWCVESTMEAPSTCNQENRRGWGWVNIYRSFPLARVKWWSYLCFRRGNFVLCTTRHWPSCQRRQQMCREPEIGAKILLHLLPFSCIVLHSNFIWPLSILTLLHETKTWLQPRRCSNSRGSPAAGRRQLCSNGAPGCKTVAVVTAPHRPDAQLRLCGSHRTTPAVGQAQTHVFWLNTFRSNWNWPNQIKCFFKKNLVFFDQNVIFNVLH